MMMMMTVATETSVALTILFSQMQIIWLFWVLCHEVHSQWRMRIQDLDFGEGKSWGQVGAIFYRSGTRQCPYQEFFFILGCRNAYFGALSDPSECLHLRCNTSRSRPPVRLPYQADCGSKALEFLQKRALNVIPVSYTHLTLPTNREV